MPINRGRIESIVGSYLMARQTVVKEGYAGEIDWQENLSFESMTESSFLREAAWVILNSGMKEAVIRRLFDRITEIFFNWESAGAVIARKSRCEKNALAVFNNPRKIHAIMNLCARVDQKGFDAVRDSISREGVRFLESFDFVGPVTSYHLAKNLGIDVVKPDRHLVRIANAARYESPTAFCQEIANVTGDKLCVIDIVLWRFATLDPSYATHFRWP